MAEESEAVLANPADHEASARVEARIVEFVLEGVPDAEPRYEGRSR
jgi:hypothetical protein